jgi:hypothetical protein
LYNEFWDGPLLILCYHGYIMFMKCLEVMVVLIVQNQQVMTDKLPTTTRWTGGKAS